LFILSNIIGLVNIAIIDKIIIRDLPKAVKSFEIDVIAVIPRKILFSA